MAASAWSFYNQAKKKLGVDGTTGIRLDTGVFKLSLHLVGASASAGGMNPTYSTMASIGNEIVAQGGYVAGGRALTSVVWTINGASVKFDSADLVFTASGANLSAIKFAVIHYSITSATSGPPICWSKLSTTAFSVSTNNTLTIQMANAGIFTLT
jgi:hypothetical protein